MPCWACFIHAEIVRLRSIIVAVRWCERACVLTPERSPANRLPNLLFKIYRVIPRGKTDLLSDLLRAYPQVEKEAGHHWLSPFIINARLFTY